MTSTEAWLEGVADERGRVVVDGLPPGTPVRVRAELPGAGATRPAPVAWPASERWRVALVLAAGALVFGLGVVAGMGRRWSWTGFGEQDTLWGWVQLVAQPVALAMLPIGLLAGDRLRRPLVWAGLVLVGFLALCSAGGYGLHWHWTGLRNVHLWDWLVVGLFPLVLLFMPSWLHRSRRLGRPAALAIAAGLIAFAVCVIGGYRWGWRWTGFTGNTLRDWLRLLFAPFLVPAAATWVQARWSPGP